MTGIEIYKRTDLYERDARTIRLHAPEWKVLLAFDADRTLSEIAGALDLQLDEALTHAMKFLAQHWIEESPLTLEQYLKRTGATLPPSTGAAAPASDPKVESKPAAQPPKLPVTASPSGERIAHGPMRLNSVVDYIVSLVGNTPLGQLLVYRVFLRVPSELLQAEGIASVRLVNDATLIRSRSLQEAIAKAVNDVTKRPLPDGVFATA